MYCKEEMEKLGRASMKNLSFTDEELKVQITTLRSVIAYLEGRGDSDIIIFRLQADLMSFENIAWSRGTTDKVYYEQS